MGQKVHVLLDRIDRQQRRLQFALLPSEENDLAPRSLRKDKGSPRDQERPQAHTKNAGKKGKTKSKARERTRKTKGKRR
jgi:ribonuclease R